ncbi:hypothetical protein TorRG33x02_129400 [Trema orientale]|uniref:Uncharacterized protein n=1 Tax=Trema orientale TaxID=63057 RepID=A0A2P5F0Q2_TREOI|nr:hypothetical protein TorRG33x02_129400 [Trema orientale]
MTNTPYTMLYHSVNKSWVFWYMQGEYSECSRGLIRVMSVLQHGISDGCKCGSSATRIRPRKHQLVGPMGFKDGFQRVAQWA